MDGNEDYHLKPKRLGREGSEPHDLIHIQNLYKSIPWKLRGECYLQQLGELGMME